MEETTLEKQLKPDIDQFENRYRYLLRTTNFLYDRRFHLITTVMMTLIMLVLAVFDRHIWYANVLVVTALAACWYVFFQTDKLRGEVKGVPQDGSMLIQMNHRKKILDQISWLRFSSFIYTVLIFITIWSFRDTEKRFDVIGLVMISLLLGFAVITTYMYNKRIKTTRAYLRNLIAILEGQ